jgi:gliding motility-associated-like protein
MKKLVGLVLMLLFALSSTGQQFTQRNFFGLNPYQLPQAIHLNDGSLIQALSEGGNSPKIQLIKTNNCGALEWAKEITNSKTAGRLVGMVQHQNSIYIAAVFGNQYPDDALTLLKINSRGQIVWANEITSSPMYWYTLSVNKTGSLFLSGNTNQPGSNANVIAKLTANGTLIWSKSYTQNHIWGMGVPDEQGGYLRITGRTVFLLDANGTPQWIKHYNSQYQSQTLPLSTNDGFVIFSAQLTGGVNRGQAFKINLQGQVQWSSPVFLNGSFSHAIASQNGQILMANVQAGPSSNQTELIWLKADGQPEKSYWLPNDQGITGSTALSENEEGTIYLHSAANLAGQSALNLLEIKLQATGNENCSWELANLSTENYAVQENFTPNLPQGQNVALNLLPVNVNLQDFNTTINTGCTNKPVLSQLLLGNDTTLCPGESLIIKPHQNPTGIYLWSNGSTEKEITVDQPGKYWLLVTPFCDSPVSSDTLTVRYHPGPNFEIKSAKTNYIFGETALLESQGNGNAPVSWRASMGDTTTGNSWSLVLDQAGLVKITACLFTLEGCQICDSLNLQVDIDKLHLPNAFTPNGDGLNETFGPAEGALAFYQLFIKDRYGKTLAQLTNQNWDGYHQGQAANTGVYVYELEYQVYKGQPRQIKRGRLTLLK